MSEQAAEGKSEMDSAAVRMLVKLYYEMQDLRIRTENRIRAAVEHGLPVRVAKMLRSFLDERMRVQETEAKRLVFQQIRKEQLWTEWLRGVQGVGPCIAGGLMAYLADCGRFDTVSKLWKYCGMHVEDNGTAPRRQKGVKLGWNPTLHTLAWKAGHSFALQGGEGQVIRVERPDGTRRCGHRHATVEKAQECLDRQVERFGGDFVLVTRHEETPSGYRKLYDQEKARLLQLHPEPVEWDPPRKKKDGTPLLRYSPGHIDAMARRKVAKVFLAHYWHMARTLAGHPTREVYAVEVLGHTTPIPVIMK